jgi:hypothetical protein
MVQVPFGQVGEPERRTRRYGLPSDLTARSSPSLLLRANLLIFPAILIGESPPQHASPRRVASFTPSPLEVLQPPTTLRRESSVEPDRLRPTRGNFGSVPLLSQKAISRDAVDEQDGQVGLSGGGGIALGPTLPSARAALDGLGGSLDGLESIGGELAGQRQLPPANPSALRGPRRAASMPRESISLRGMMLCSAGS